MGNLSLVRVGGVCAILVVVSSIPEPVNASETLLGIN